MEVGNAFYFVNITHHSGVKFRVRLKLSDIEKANADPVYLEQLASQYYKMYENGLITPIAIPVSSPETVPEPETPEPDDYEYDHNMDTLDDIENMEPVSESEIHDTLINETGNYSSANLSTEHQPPSTSNDQRYIWSRDAVLLLLEELHKRKDNLQQPHKKRILFGEIARVLLNKKYKVTWESCERKWRGLQTMYKKKKSIENKSGSGAVQWEYYEKVEEIIACDPAYNPIMTAAVGAETSGTSRIAPVAKKCQATTREWLEKSFKETNKNIQELKETFNDFKQVQIQRNTILDRVATALEKLTD